MNEIKITEVNNGFIISTSNETHVATKDNTEEFANILNRLLGDLGVTIPTKKSKETKKILPGIYKPGIYIVHPKTAELFTFEEWKKQEDPTTANLIAVVTEDTRLYVCKSVLGNKTFAEAQAVASKYHHPGMKNPFRCPTFKEWFDLYYASYKGLNDAIRLIGGDPLLNYMNWTCEEHPHPEYSSDFAFACDEEDGDVSNYSKYYKYRVRPVSAF